MNIYEERRDSVLILALEGRLDATSSKMFEDKIVATIDAGETGIVIDLSLVDYVSSAGLRVFLFASKRLNPTGGKLVLCSLQDSVREVFDIVGFLSILSIHGSRDEAFRSLS